MVELLSDKYLVNYSRMYKKFSLLDMATGHIVVESDLFFGLYDTIKRLKKEKEIELIFSDEAVDELSKRGF